MSDDLSLMLQSVTFYMLTYFSRDMVEHPVLSVIYQLVVDTTICSPICANSTSFHCSTSFQHPPSLLWFSGVKLCTVFVQL